MTGRAVPAGEREIAADLTDQRSMETDLRVAFIRARLSETAERMALLAPPPLIAVWLLADIEATCGLVDVLTGHTGRAGDTDFDAGHVAGYGRARYDALTAIAVRWDHHPDYADLFGHHG